MYAACFTPSHDNFVLRKHYNLTVTSTCVALVTDHTIAEMLVSVCECKYI